MKIIDRKFLNVTTPSCHAGTMAIYKDKPIYSWFGGSQEGAPDVAIYIQCGNTIHVIGGKDTLPRWNPILFPYNDKLYLFVKAGRFCDCWATLIYNISNIFEYDFDIDNARFQILPAGLNGPVKTKAIVDSYGGIYCGSSVETIMDWTSYIETFKIKDGIFKFVERSHPLMVSKKAYEDPYYGKRLTMGIIQPSLWRDSNNLHAFFRSSRGLGKIYHSIGIIDNVLFWSDPEPTKFDNPNSGIDTVYTNNRLFLAYNPSSINREPLVVSELDKDFNVIEQLVITEKAEGNVNTKELSYPYMIENNGNLELVYTYGRKKLEQVTIGI